MQTLTKFEELFADGSIPALRPEKTLAYDFDNAMFHLPTKWIKESLPTAGSHPSDTELRKDAIYFIQGEYGSSTGRGEWRGLPRMESGTDKRIDDVVWKYLKACESSIYSGAYDQIIYAKDKTEGERFRLLLSDAHLGKKQNTKFLVGRDFEDQVAERLARKEPIQIVLPSFPFKDQNPFRTDLPAHSLDLGEVAMLIRLHALALALYQIHAFGVQWVIVCDGKVYSKIFGVQPAEVEEYREELRRWRNRLNLQQTVQIVDFEDVIRKLVGPDETSDRFWNQCHAVAERLKTMVESEGEETLRKAFLTLCRGMKWNLNTKEYSNGKSVSMDQLWHILNSEDAKVAPPGAAQNVIEEIDHRAKKAAYGYLGFNLQMGYYSKGLSHVLPKALRATVHPKPGQIAAPNAGGKVFPWNGRCLVSDEEAMTMDGLRCCQLFEFAQEGHSELICRGVNAREGSFYLMSKCQRGK